MTEIRTHTEIRKDLSGEPVELGEGYAKVKLKTTEDMKADKKGLIHGGFIFSAGDYTAMLCVNHPNVVLAGASVSFLKPVKVGDELIFEGKIIRDEGKKKVVQVIAKKGEEIAFKGDFYCVIPEKHVLD